VIRSYGLGMLPEIFNRTEGRQEVKRLTGNTWVPVLVTDDDEVIQDSKKIIAWAERNPAGAASAGEPPAASG
jgi:glutathione S-transferase